MVTRDAGSAMLDLKVFADSPVFGGHFPGNPVLPGVVMVEAVRRALQDVLGREYHLDTAHHIKFLAVLNPYETPLARLSLTWQAVKEENETVAIEARIFSESTVYFKMKGVYNPG